LLYDGGLQGMIKQARIDHLNQYYGPKICRIVGKPPLGNYCVSCNIRLAFLTFRHADDFLDRSSSESGFVQDRLFQAALLLSASINAMLSSINAINTPVAYGTIKSLYALIIACGNWQEGAEDSADKGDIYSHLDGKTVRHFFTLEEEAFILAVTDLHLHHYKTGSNSKKSTTYLLWDDNHSREFCNLLAHQETQQGKGVRSATFHFPKRPNIFDVQPLSDSPANLSMYETTAVRVPPSREAKESLISPSSNTPDAAAVRVPPSREAKESLSSPSSNTPDAAAVRVPPPQEAKESLGSPFSNTPDAAAVRVPPSQEAEESLSSPSSNTLVLRRSKRAKQKAH
jgi:hypothetical protein